MIQTYIQNLLAKNLEIGEAVVLGVFRTRIVAGTIKRLDIYTGAPMAADITFNLRINGVAQFSGASRPKVTAGTDLASKTGLEIAISRGDVVSIDIENNPRVNTINPLTVFLGIDDGVSVASEITNANLLSKMLERFEAGDNVSIEEVEEKIVVSADGGGVSEEDVEQIIDDYLAAGDGVNLAIVGTDLEISTEVSDSNLLSKILALLEEGDDVTIEEVDNKIVISATGGGGSGEANTASNVGTGAEVFKEKDSLDLVFRKIKAGTGVTVTENTNDITIEASGGGGGSNAFELICAASDEGTNITTGNAKVTFRFPAAITLTDIKASLSVAPASGTPAYRVNKNGSTIFSTNLTIDASEKTSRTAAAAYVFSGGSTVSFTEDDEITIDVVTAGTGTRGLKITFIGTR